LLSCKKTGAYNDVDKMWISTSAYIWNICMYIYNNYLAFLTYPLLTVDKSVDN